MRLMSSFVIGGAMIASSLLAAAPQTAEPPTIAAINGDRVLEGSSIGQKARERLESEAKIWEDRASGLNTELDTLTRQRQEQALTLSETALARLNQDIEEKQVQVQRLNDDARRELTRLQDQVTVDVNQQLGPLVERFATERGLHVILDSARMQGLLYLEPTRDLTDDFVALVNASMPALGPDKQDDQ